MMTEKKHIILVAGEASGDMHAAHLVDALKKIDPLLTFSGLGGRHMQASGVTLYKDMTRLAVVGFVEVLRHYREIKQSFELIRKKVLEIKPRAVILVDYPGFNLRLAKELKKKNIKVIYYISPQVWAWKEERVKQIKEHVDEMLVLFPFEADFYARFGVKVHFVGHPLVDAVKTTQSKKNFQNAAGIRPHYPTVGLLPGSRQGEIENLLPVMLEAAALMKKEFPNLQFVLIKAPTIPEALLREYLSKSPLDIAIIEEHIYDGINICDVCMVASGTATLETAILKKPMVVVYKTSFLTWVLAKLFVKIPDIGLVNIVAGRRIVPECVQFEATGRAIARELINIMTNELQIAEIKSGLQKVKESLGESGSSRRAAEEILKVIRL